MAPQHSTTSTRPKSTPPDRLPGVTTPTGASCATAAGIELGQIYYGPSLALNYNEPTADPRTPDIIVTPNVGVTYSGSTAKLAELGGFAHDDTNVILLLSNSSFQSQTVRAEVGTAQVAPTILQALGLNPPALSAVLAEGAASFRESNFGNRPAKA